ncbi:hypothetical protein BCR33DRAFT_719229 [Rhizoclosmatium globosum]|uniref:Uncharacterized protein n=1 Tax=Rhizoclosmatium globosum TaxID=329046 RepID=A0A1Y2C0X2_9FUNG|nr:hypothetical protein BCR33DRAFT_719229 [Rhizoclosmatium globosum]|eukprot:ORY40682.1 hypothetical protein BCR33DRAFT_719229 [Rhizoclosmatium globosum]
MNSESVVPTSPSHTSTSTYPGKSVVRLSPFLFLLYSQILNFSGIGQIGATPSLLFVHDAWLL